MGDPGLELLDPSFSRDPYGVFRRLRETAPVLWSPALQCWIVTGYEACREVLRDPGIGVGRAGYLASVRASVGPGRAYDYVSRRMTTYEPPDHHRLRSAVHAGFTAHRLARLRRRIDERAAALLAGCATAPGGRADVVARVTHPLPSQVICELLGVPEDDRPAFDAWTAALAPLIGPAPTLEQIAAGRVAAAEEWDHVTVWLARRRRTGGGDDDVATELLAAEASGEVTADEVVATVMFLFSAGHQTTRDLLGNGLWSILRQRDQWTLLTERPELVPAAVTEMLRHDTSVTVTVRGADRDLEVAGARIPAGCGLVLALAAANRDPAHYPDPDRFLVERPDSRPLSFGGGAHHCLGAALARMEAEAVLRELVTRYPATDLDGEAVGPEYRSGLTFRGPLALPLVVR